VISEGVAMLVLKRLDDAERDGDRIYAVIQGTGGASDGKAKGVDCPAAARTNAGVTSSRMRKPGFHLLRSLSLRPMGRERLWVTGPKL